MTDREVDRLLTAVREGDNDAFAELYEGVGRGVFAFIYSYLGNYHDSEDALQTVFYKIKMNISSYRPHSRGMPWILEIAKNHSLNVLRSRRHEAVELDVELLGDEPTENGFTTGVMDVMRRTLTATEIRIIVLHVISGYRHREIASLLGMTPVAVRTKYIRALDKMKAALGEDYKEGL